MAIENISPTSPSKKQLNTLLEHYQTGRFSDAENLSIFLTNKFPSHPFSWKVLGAVHKQTGRLTEALTYMRKSLQIEPEDAEAYNNFGVTLQELGRLDEAKENYIKAIAFEPDYAEAHSNLGVTLQKLGKLEEALVSYYQAIELVPDYAEAHNNLGTALQELGQLEKAIASYNKAIVIKPDYAECHNNLGNSLYQLGRLEEAEASYIKAIALKPEYVEAYNNLGITLQELNRSEEAEASYIKAINLKPDYAEVYNNLGNTLQELSRLEEAEASYTQAVTLKPNLAEAYNNLGNTLQDLGKLEDAEASYTQAISLEPKYAKAYCNLGNTHKELGRLEEAEASYTQAIILKPDYAEAHRYLTSLKKYKLQDEQYLKMQELYLNKYISEEDRCHINFGLAKACEDLGDFEQAFVHYNEGNFLRKKLLKYDIIVDIELFKRIKSSYHPISKKILKPENFEKTTIPIFIVGMPRSGTTLVEQIISSHSCVTGAGELYYIQQFGGLLASGSSEPSKATLLDFREKYLKKLKSISKGNSIVTDKMPQNFRYLGLIASAFPEAKIVHVKRDAAAVCWANYQQYFVSKHLGYCYALDDVLSYYMLYESLMGFWGKFFSQRIYNLDYELLTVNQKSETSKLIDYLGLDWDEKCLSPQDNTRRVATASNTQVRKKVYQGSSQQWRKYELFLDGALDSILKP